ncbi:sugar O-acetyltransferase [Marinilactibacillus sp. GCM10026970]|uniref:sugar O-acetyltransferase n=1 Tax=Marinilactibacillus sp. GCM10026970 TaxID=3252642 RepID=UPI00360A74CA
MTEKEKMLNQEFYDTWDASLIEEREVTRNLIFEFNQINPTKREERRAFVEKLIPNIGENSWIESPFTCEYGGNMYIGDNFYSNTNCTILDCAKVTIGNDVLFGPNVSLYTPNHAFDPEERKAGLEQTLPITIGDNVWLCGSVSITGGVSIGENTIIGAGSVVTKDMPANVIAAGNPCKVIRPITEADKVNP